MKYLRYLAIAAAVVVIVLSARSAFAQTGVGTLDPWKFGTGTQITPRNPSSTIRIPSLGSAGLCLSTNASGTLSVTTCGSGGGGTPGGSDTSVQFNDNGTFGGDALLTWDKVGTLTIGGTNPSTIAGNGNDSHIGGNLLLPGYVNADQGFYFGVAAFDSTGNQLNAYLPTSTSTVTFLVGSPQTQTNLSFANASTTPYTFTFPGQSGTFCLTSTCLATTTGNWVGTWQLRNPSDFLASSTAYVATTTGSWLGTWQGNSPSFFLANSASSSFAFRSNNLSDLNSTSTARSNLGLGDAALTSSSTYFKVANNLSEAVSSTVRSNVLGTGTGSQIFFGDGVFKTPSTTNVTEGTNLYWTQARFNTALNGTTTTGLPEGTNLYWTQARFNTALGTVPVASTSLSVQTPIALNGNKLSFTGNYASSGQSGIAIASSSGNTWTFSQPTSTDSVSGYLSAADHATFNAKATAGAYTTTTISAGTGISVSNGGIGATTVTNTQPHVTSTIAAGGGTATGNAFALATSTGSIYSILCGTATCTWNQTASSTWGLVPSSRNVNTTGPITGGGALTGDLTIACATCQVQASSTINNTIGPWTFSTTTTGNAFTITTSTQTVTWNFPARINTINNLATTTGGLLVATSSPNGWTALGVGSNGKVLTASSTAPNGVSWETATAGGGGITSINGDSTAAQTVVTTTQSYRGSNVSTAGGVTSLDLPNPSLFVPTRGAIHNPGVNTFTTTGVGGVSLYLGAAGAVQDDAGGTFERYATSTANGAAGVDWGATVQARWQPDVSFNFRTSPTSTNVRYWVGMSNRFNTASLVGTSTIRADEAVFRYATDVDTDGFWKAITSNGSSVSTLTTTTVAFATSTSYNFRVRYVSASQVNFYINNALVASSTTNLPTGGTSNALGAAVSPTIADGECIDFGWFTLVNNGVSPQ